MVTRPVSGVVDFASSSFEGIKRLVNFVFAAHITYTAIAENIDY